MEVRLRAVEMRLMAAEAKVARLEEHVEEHRAIILGEGREGAGGLRALIYAVQNSMNRRIDNQNKLLTLLILIGLLDAPKHIVDVVAFLKEFIHP